MFSHQRTVVLSFTVRYFGHLSFVGLLILLCRYCYAKLRVGITHGCLLVSNAMNAEASTHMHTHPHTLICD